MQRSPSKVDEVVEIDSSDSEVENDKKQEQTPCVSNGVTETQVKKQCLAGEQSMDINKLMSDLVNMCYSFQNSNEMNTLMKKIILPNFAKANKNYVNSEAFYKIVQNVYTKMLTKNMLCFTGLKRINMNLKANEAGLQHNECIELDDLSDTEVKADSDPDVIEVEDDEAVCKRPRLENNVVAKKRVQLTPLDNVEMGNVFVENEVQYMTVETDSRLIPLGEIDTKTYLSNSGDNVKKKTEKDIRAEAIEQEILNCLIGIQAYDQAEVDFDREDSAYIQSNRLKRKLIKLYEQLMEIKGCQPEYKSHVVQLEVPKGQPKGPVRRLEALLNKKQIINFPDFHDVVKCVATANIEDNLRWTSEQILTESRSLFTQCGRQLQRRRQNLEWRHVQEMMVIGDDPADTDPELKAKLDANMEIGRKKERDVLEMFTKADICLRDRKGVSVTYDNRENKILLGSQDVGNQDEEDSEDDNEDSGDESFLFVKADNELILVSSDEDHRSIAKDKTVQEPRVPDLLDETLFDENDNHSMTILFDSSDEENYDT